MNFNLPITISTNVKIQNVNTGEILLDKSNAIHSQNMSRIISRALGHETNSWIYRIAYGNGGTFIDAAGNIVFNTPNDGSDGSWESRLYNETYSEVIDDLSGNLGIDPGSADTANVRPGAGSDPTDDPPGNGVVSQEVGLKSNVIVSDYINENEPSGQSTSSSTKFTISQDCFIFDEIGLYSPGLPERATNGFSTVNVGNMTSDDLINLPPNSTNDFSIIIDGTEHNVTVNTPSSGSGADGALTFGDFCEGLNTGSWVTGNLNTILYTYITDNSSGTYPSILNKQSNGFLIFQSKTTGSNSSVEVLCVNVGEQCDLMCSMVGCSNCNIETVQGVNAGIQNDAINPTNERERLLTHIIFEPIPKSADTILAITYTLTVSVARTKDSQTQILNS